MSLRSVYDRLKKRTAVLMRGKFYIRIIACILCHSKLWFERGSSCNNTSIILVMRTSSCWVASRWQSTRPGTKDKPPTSLPWKNVWWNSIRTSSPSRWSSWGRWASSQGSIFQWNARLFFSKYFVFATICKYSPVWQVSKIAILIGPERSVATAKFHTCL